MTALVVGDGHVDMLNHISHCDICVLNLHRLFSLQVTVSHCGFGDFVLQHAKQAETEPVFKLAVTYREEAQAKYPQFPNFDDMSSTLIEFYNKQNQVPAPWSLINP